MTTDLIIIDPAPTSDHRPPTTDQEQSSVVGRQSPALSGAEGSVVVVHPLPDAAILAGQVAPSSVRMYRRAYAAYAGDVETAKDPITLARPPGWRDHALSQHYQPHARRRQAHHGRGWPAGLYQQRQRRSVRRRARRPHRGDERSAQAAQSHQ